MSIHATIREQLGGNQFDAMTGARIYIARDDRTLSFKLPRSTENGINYVTIRLEDNDTYTVTFAKLSRDGMKCVTKIERTMVYADQLRKIFTEATSL
jgi:hypothetical protein